jgi:hypothetical protein
LLGTKTKRRRLAPAARGGIPVPTRRIPASERTSQKLEELQSQGVADGDARTELLKLAVRKIVEEALEAEVAEAVGRGYYENGAEPGAGYRDIEAAFQDATGASLLSRTAVSQVTDRSWQEYEAFASRDLSEFAVAYFFVDGVAERLHAGMPREAVLCAWGSRRRARRCCCTWRRARRRTRPVARRSSRTSNAEGWRTPCWSSPTARPG